MPISPSRFQLTRRRFAFWVGLGLFNLAETLRADVLDDLAAAAMRATEKAEPKSPATPAEHWTAAENNTWTWYERENLVDGRWKLTGITTPIHKRTGQRHEAEGYLADNLVPEAVLRGEVAQVDWENGAIEDDPGKPNPMRPRGTGVRPAAGCAACAPTSCAFG